MCPLTSAILTYVNCPDYGTPAFSGSYGPEKSVEVPYRDIGRLILALQTLSEQHAGPIKLGILSTRRAESFLTAVAAFCSGIIFVPLNPKFPIARIKRIIQLSGVNKIAFDLSTRSLFENLDCDGFEVAGAVQNQQEHIAPLRISSVTRESDVAYYMFTSGTTGDPKGVPLTYGSLSNYVTVISERLKFRAGARFSHVFDISFDLAIDDIFMSAFNGGTLVGASDANLLLPWGYAVRKKIDYWSSVPLMGTLLCDQAKDAEAKPQFELAMFCGEALPSKTASEFYRHVMKPAGLVWNLYGPTETNVVTAYLCGRDSREWQVEPLGQALKGSTLAILKDDGDVEPVGAGIMGELLLGGVQVFHGYDPAVGASPFIYSDKNRYYRSGDLVRVNGDLAIEYLGRTDHQVKIRGYRIELGEIENVFRRSHQVSDVVCGAIGQGSAKKIWLAYAAKTPVESPNNVFDELPQYMRPSLIKYFTTLPTNTNGKADRNAIATILADEAVASA